MKDWLKITGCVVLISLLGADIGLQTTLWFGAPTRNSTPKASRSVQTESSKEPEGAPDNGYKPLIIGVLTFAVLACQTLIFLRQTDISHELARIARKQIDVVERLERPLLLPLMPRFYHGFATNPGLNFPDIEVGLRNYGRSPAIITKATVFAVVSRDVPPAQNEDNRFIRIEGPPRKIVGITAMHWSNPCVPPDGQLGPIDVAVHRPSTEVELREVQDGTNFVWVDGHVIYTDMFGAKRETFFLWRYDHHLDIMIASDIAGRNRYT